MFSTRAKIEYGGEVFSLKAWCAANMVPYDRGLKRWHEGIRDPVELLYGDHGMPRMVKIPDADIRFLKKSRYARAGQPDEWQIACDLIAQPYVRIPEIKELVLND